MLINQYHFNKFNENYFKYCQKLALDGVAQWIEHGPESERVAVLTPVGAHARAVG